jgi:hypothetical protein
MLSSLFMLFSLLKSLELSCRQLKQTKKSLEEKTCLLEDSAANTTRQKEMVGAVSVLENSFFNGLGSPD